MNKLLLTFYGDDFTGSTDALEQLTLAGVSAALFIRPPTPAQLEKFPGLQAVGVAGKTRSLSPDALEQELQPALKKLKTLGARHVHYKVCSTFDSSPSAGSIGRAIDVAAKIFRSPFFPLLVAAPALGRYTVFGTHFARYGIGSTGVIHRLDLHPSVSKHPVTPMTEADLRLHLSRQTSRRIGHFDILKVALPTAEARKALQKLLAEKPDVILFDAISSGDMARIGELLEMFARPSRPLFSVGSSGIEAALASQWNFKQPAKPVARPSKLILIGSGSCSPVASGQIQWALKQGFAEVPMDALALARAKAAASEIKRAAGTAAKWLQAGRSVIVHTTKAGSHKHVKAKLKTRTAEILGTALGDVLGGALAQSSVRRICIAGGDTSSYAARALGIEALEMIAPLTPGAPLCRVHAPNSPADGREIVFKGGQVGAMDYFEILKRGKT